MSAVLKILQESLESQSSGTGVSYYKSAAQCIRKALLTKDKDKQVLEPPSSDDAKIGTIFHKLMELYYGANEPLAIEVMDVNFSTNAIEALRLAKEYTSRFKTTDFKTVGSEINIPANDEEKARLEQFLGVPFTARVDLVVELDERDCSRMEQSRKLFGLTPGLYILDFKTMKAKKGQAELLYRVDPQFRGYQVVWNYLHPDRPVQGMIADCIVRHKKLTDESFFSVLVPRPTTAQTHGWIKWLRFVDSQIKTFPGSYNLGACFSGFYPCDHLLSGRCDQT